MAVYRRAFARPQAARPDDRRLDHPLPHRVSHGHGPRRGGRPNRSRPVPPRRSGRPPSAPWPACSRGVSATGLQAALRVVLVGAPARHPLLRQLPPVLEALPHHHVDPEHLLHEPRADGQAPDRRPRELGAVRRLAGRGPHLEVDARRLHLHGVRTLPRRVPDRPDGKAARPEDLHRRRARRGVRGHAFDPRRRRSGAGTGPRGRRAGSSSGAGSPRTRSGPARCAGSARRRARSSSSRPSTRSPRCGAISCSTRPSFPKEVQNAFRGHRDQRQPVEHRRPRRAPTGPRTCRSRRWPGGRHRGRGPLLGRLRRLLRRPREEGLAATWSS